jgi:hypothetical protein
MGAVLWFRETVISFGPARGNDGIYDRVWQEVNRITVMGLAIWFRTGVV